jgi:hypothetical protein
MTSVLTVIKKHDKAINTAWFVLLILAPMVLWLLPGDYFDSEDGLILCPSRALFDFECLGCGMTRAVMHFHHFQFDDAVYFNRGSLIVYPALVIVWAVWTFKAWKKSF